MQGRISSKRNRSFSETCADSSQPIRVKESFQYDFEFNFFLENEFGNFSVAAPVVLGSSPVNIASGYRLRVESKSQTYFTLLWFSFRVLGSQQATLHLYDATTNHQLIDSVDVSIEISRPVFRYRKTSN